MLATQNRCDMNLTGIPNKNTGEQGGDGDAEEAV
jgi:hypothetical protein